MVTRHGNYCKIDGNFFIGDGISDQMGGIRIINTGHWVTNNYFYNMKGENFRSPLAIMNGIPKSPLNRYNQVTDVVVAHNTWINCTSPWQFGVGTNISQKDVLPPSEIRSARPIRTVVANNLIYNEEGDEEPIVAHDVIDGVLFKNNVINNQNVAFEKYEGLNEKAFEIKKVSENIFTPTQAIAELELYEGFEFETIQRDIFGNDRSRNNWIGAISSAAKTDPMILDKSKYGTSWYNGELDEREPETHIVTADKGDLGEKLVSASRGDIISLEAGSYHLTNSLVINKQITIQSADKNNPANIHYSGAAGSPVFEMHPKGDLSLKSIILTGENTQYAFSSLKDNMSSLYNLEVTDCEISNFQFVLKAFKESFADEITFSESSLKNCQNGIELSEETNDKGDYNTEYLRIDNCQFDRIPQNVIDYYRGGYDESTIGGNLIVTNSSFTNCGRSEENGILLNTRGIINVDISKNVFKNNPVKLVALLWGAKNNTHSENQIINSGKIVVEENLKLKLFY
jgi:poly(beta-D-mannuronate) lyase